MGALVHEGSAQIGLTQWNGLSHVRIAEIAHRSAALASSESNNPSYRCGGIEFPHTSLHRLEFRVELQGLRRYCIQFRLAVGRWPLAVGRLDSAWQISSRLARVWPGNQRMRGLTWRYTDPVDVDADLCSESLRPKSDSIFKDSESLWCSDGSMGFSISGMRLRDCSRARHPRWRGRGIECRAFHRTV